MEGVAVLTRAQNLPLGTSVQTAPGFLRVPSFAQFRFDGFPRREGIALGQFFLIFPILSSGVKSRFV